MEKILEKYIMDDVFKVIDKHIRLHNVLIDDVKSKIEIAEVLGVEDLMLENHLLEIRDSCSAIAGLKMLKKELSGEVEY